MGTTKYNGAYKGEVIASLKQAMSGLKSCKSVSIDIPSDFEAAGTLRNALDTLKGIDIKGAVSEIKSASADFERAENELNNYLGNFLDLFQVEDKNESVKNTKEQLEETQRLLNRNLEKQQKATRKNKKTTWDKLLENNLKKSEKSTKIANQAIAKEQQRTQEKTRRVQASAQNTLVATGAMVVEPEAAPTIVPITIGMNSGGRASGFNFKVGVSNLLSLSLNSSNRMSYETKKDNHDAYHQLREDVNKEHNSIIYYLYKFGTEIIDNVGKTEAKVSKFAKGILANFDDSVNLSNKVKSRNNTVAEIIELSKSWINLEIKNGEGLLNTGIEKGHRIVNNVQNKIKENQNKANIKRKNEVFDRLSELRYSSKYSQDLINDFEKNGLDKDVKANIFGIKCKVNVNNVDKVLEQYGLENGYSNTQRLYWTMQHMNRDSGYGINQGIYRKHFWYETNDGEMIGVRKKQYEEAINEGKELTLKYDDFIKNRAKEIVKRHKVSYKEALEIIEIIDTPGGMCSIATAAESIAYQYADKPDVFEKKFGFPLYDEEKNLNDEIYIDYFMYTSSKQNMLEINHSDIMKRDSDDKVYSVNKERVVENEAGMYSLKENNYTYTTYWPFLSANIHSGQTHIIEYLNHNQRDLASANSLETICTKEKGDIDNIIKAINEDKSITLQVDPKNDEGIPMRNFQGDVVDSIDGGHAVNVVSVEDNNLIICTWGGLYKIDYNELMDNSSYCLFESIDVIK